MLRAVPAHSRAGRPEFANTPEAVRLLLMAGASPFEATDDGATPLAIAADHDLQAVIEQLER